MPPSNATSPPPAAPAATDAEVEQHLALAVTAHGNRPDLAQKEASLRWLAAHADRAYPIAIERAKATPTPGLLEVIGRLGRPEATHWLGELLRTESPSTAAAATALARSPDPKAKDALVAALRSPESAVVIAALDGLRVRGDRSICAELTPFADHRDPEVRYVWVRAGASLGCLDAAALRALATADADADVRQLAVELGGK